MRARSLNLRTRLSIEKANFQIVSIFVCAPSGLQSHQPYLVGINGRTYVCVQVHAYVRLESYANCQLMRRNLTGQLRTVFPLKTPFGGQGQLLHSCIQDDHCQKT